jgi:positive regulator of sigma E activity
MNKKIFGFTCLALSCFMWFVPILIHFLHLSAAQLAFWTTAAIVLGELLFVLSVFLLGKEFFQRIKEGIKKSLAHFSITFKK